MEENTKKRRRIRKRTIYAIILSVMLACFVMIIFLLLFQVRKIEVEGNQYMSSQEIADWIGEDEKTANSVYALIKFRFTNYELPAALEDVSVSMKNPWTLKATVTEKQVAGYITMGDDAVYFDKDGIVLAKTTEWWDEVPCIEGLTVDEVTLYQQLPVSEDNKKVFSSLLEMSQSLKENELVPDRIVCSGDSLYLFFGNVCANIGEENFRERIAQIPPILEKLQGTTGTIHLENYGESSTTVSFRRDEIPQFETQQETAPEATGEEASEAAEESPQETE